MAEPYNTMRNLETSPTGRYVFIENNTHGRLHRYHGTPCYYHFTYTLDIVTNGVLTQQIILRHKWYNAMDLINLGVSANELLDFIRFAIMYPADAVVAFSAVPTIGRATGEFHDMYVNTLIFFETIAAKRRNHLKYLNIHNIAISRNAMFIYIGYKHRLIARRYISIQAGMIMLSKSMLVKLIDPPIHGKIVVDSMYGVQMARGAKNTCVYFDETVREWKPRDTYVEGGLTHGNLQ